MANKTLLIDCEEGWGGKAMMLANRYRREHMNDGRGPGCRNCAVYLTGERGETTFQVWHTRGGQVVVRRVMG